jgi:hypothetical protein
MDDFYKQHLFSNYGDVGLSVKELVDKFAQASKQHQQVWVLRQGKRGGGWGM